MSTKKTFSRSLELSLLNESLEDFRMSLDETIQQVIQKMTVKGIEEGKVNAVLNIRLSKVEEPNLDEDVYIPKFDHKVTSTYQEKTEISGSFGGADYEVVSADGIWRIRNAENGQMSMNL
ncbi:hypothetical protein EI53_01886 [Fusobacterium naviforme]|nr:hypothetical protein F7P78_06820 [Fusobacterium naviforme]PSL09102.1 hypothetical protein EI53_01886 [Fusobacterium naviforme]STO27714.1 Uncharacterised protein [Fusobacterium naviforme]